MIFDSYFLACLLYIFLSVPAGSLWWREVVEVPLDLGDAVLQGQQPLAQETLQGHGEY